MCLFVNGIKSKGVSSAIIKNRHQRRYLRSLIHSDNDALASTFGQSECKEASTFGQTPERNVWER